jgi:hypothetical protein
MCQTFGHSGRVADASWLECAFGAWRWDAKGKPGGGGGPERGHEGEHAQPPQHGVTPGELRWPLVPHRGPYITTLCNVQSQFSASYSILYI